MSKYEIEQKFRIKDPKQIRKLFRKLGARKISSGGEYNELFDDAGRLRSRGCALRLRRNSKPNQALLTYKGPKLKGRFKKRIEIEFTVPYRAAKAVLNSIGFKVHSSYVKSREEYRLGKTHLTIDRLRGDGWFVEIEGTASEIDRLSKALGFSDTDREERTYIEITETSKTSRRR